MKRSKRTVKAWAVFHPPTHLKGMIEIYYDAIADTRREAMDKFMVLLPPEEKDWSSFYRQGARVRRVEISWEDK